MNKINELKTKLEKLIQEKQSNEESIKVLQQDNVDAIRYDLDCLNDTMQGVRRSKKLSLALHILSLVSAFGSIALLSVIVFYLQYLPIYNSAVSGLSVTGLMLIGLFGSKISLDKYFKYGASLNSIKDEIDNKKEQMDLSKQNEKTNKQALSKLERESKYN